MTRRTKTAAVAALTVVALVVAVAFVVVGRDPDGEPRATASPTADGPVSREATATVTTATIRSASPATVYRGGLYVEPWGAAASAAEELAEDGTGEQRAAAQAIAQESVAIWLSSFYDDDELLALIDRNVVASRKAGTTPVFVTYDIPHRDCGGKSAGGTDDAEEYLRRNQLVADALQGQRATVLVEPDSLGQLATCPEQTRGRTATLSAAVTQFYRAGIPAYLDGGNSSWIDGDVMTKRLRASGIDKARGFFTNVANYQTEADERAYAEELAESLGDDVHYVVDIGRNGTGWRGTWCNGRGAGLGRTPRVAQDGQRIDAFLWVKTPGASDGRCTGGPRAGAWFADYAVDLVENRREQ